jgi:hypothetical protein
LPSDPPLVERPVEATAEMVVRHAELKSISERLDRIGAQPRARRWESRSEIAMGAVFGGAVGLIPFVASEPSALAVVIYVAVVVTLLGLSQIFWKAAEDVSAERGESIKAIKEHIDNTLLTTETPRLQAPSSARRFGPGEERPALGSSPPPRLPGAD